MKLVLLGVIFFLYFLFAQRVSASDALFRQSVHAVYELQTDNNVKASYDIQITNLTSEQYAPSLHISFDGFSPSNMIAFENGVPVVISQDTQNHLYTVNFKKPAVGRGVTKRVNIAFTDASLVSQNSQITRVYLPVVSSILDYYVYTVDLKVPKTLLRNISITPKPSDILQTNSFNVYSFKKEALNSPINADFGDFEDYSYKITYPISSFIFRDGTYQIALPPDTSYQKVSINSISLTPDNVLVDKDGNWVALFKNKPKKQVVATGKVRLFESPVGAQINMDEASRVRYLSQTKFWQKDATIIQSYAKEYRTPLQIYNFVTNYLKYDFAKTNRPATRMGALLALEKRDEAVCMEFTDLFIAIARASGIPARETDGFAYTTNPSLQPLSLVSDILHSWPQYWDDSKKKWISVDPTWGNTTHGVDYFSKFDTNHIAFLILGDDTQNLNLPGTVQDTSDFAHLISISPEPGFVEDGRPDIQFKESGIPFISAKVVMRVTNLGTSSLPTLIPPLGYVETALPEGTRQISYLGTSHEIHLSFTRKLGFFGLILAFFVFLGLLVYVVKYAREHDKFSSRHK